MEDWRVESKPLEAPLLKTISEKMLKIEIVDSVQLKIFSYEYCKKNFNCINCSRAQIWPKM